VIIIGALRSGRPGRPCARPCGQNRRAGRLRGPGPRRSGRRARAGSRRETLLVRSPRSGSGPSCPFAGPRPGRRGRRPGRGGLAAAGAAGPCVRTQARNPARVETGARASRSSHKPRAPVTASGVACSGTRATSRFWWRAIAQARTPMRPCRALLPTLSVKMISYPGRYRRVDNASSAYRGSFTEHIGVLARRSMSSSGPAPT